MKHVFTYHAFLLDRCCVVKRNDFPHTLVEEEDDILA
jgi:hypothetical protein